MRAHEFLTPDTQHNPQDLADVAQWMSTTPDKLKIVVKQEPIEKFIKQIREMHGTYGEFPEDEERTNRILKLLKRGEQPMPIYVEANDPTYFVMEGRHRMVAFWLAGMKTIPVAYVSVQDQQGVAEGKIEEQSNLVSQFLKSISPKELRYYSIRDNCGPAAMDMRDWAQKQGIDLKRHRGYFVADNVVYDKADFTKEMKRDFLKQGLDFNDPNARKEFIESNPEYSEEWKKVPHYWLQDKQGNIYDPTGYIQFIKTGLARDLDSRRYLSVNQGVAEGLIAEGRNHPVIVVDVQPEYAYFSEENKQICEEIIRFVSKQTGPVLMFVNAEQTGVSTDSLEDILHYWEETVTEYNQDDPQDRPLGVPPPAPIDWRRFQIVDKGYGHLRSWMDRGTSAAAIIKTIREMYRQRVSDSRDLFDGEMSDDYDERMQQLIGNEYRQFDLDDPLIVNWTSVAQLKRFSGAYIVGGGRNECLREVELLMNAFNIKYKRIDSLVY